MPKPLKKQKEIKAFSIVERWRVMGEIETYQCERTKLSQVRSYIKDWLSSWKESAEENGLKLSHIETDFKTFAKCQIRPKKEDEFQMVDTFSLKVLPITLKL